MTDIRFGTDGWRAVIADSFTYENVRLVSQAYSDFLKAAGLGDKGVVVGFDTRFMSEHFAREAARVIAANGIHVYFSKGFATTPAVSWAIKEKGLGGGVMITASHNPAIYNGFKVKADYGGSALPSITRAIEGHLAANLSAGKRPHLIDFNAAVSGGGITVTDLWPAYKRQLERFVSPENMRRLKGKVIVDPMYGAGQGHLRGLLEGMGVEVEEIRGEVNPLFPGINPEPIPKNLKALAEAVRDRGAVAGLAIDGDGDRIGVIDENGAFVDPHRVFSLILRHLVEDRGWTGSVAKTFAVTEMVDKLAVRYGLRLHKLPVGFKYVCEKALQEDVLIGGEESGGIGIKNHIPERDGMLCALLILEIMARHQKTVGELVQGLMEEVGFHCFERADLHLSARQKEALLNKLKDSPPDQFGGLPVSRLDNLDGYKFYLGDRGWILIRPSGTEPVVRIYVEMDDPALLSRVMREGEQMALGGA